MSIQILKFGDRRRVKQIVGDVSMTQQNLAAETDVNAIMAKYAKTGVFTHVSALAAEYGDFSSVPDYQTGLNRLMEADSLFSSLPALVRERFGNDPAQFIAFSTNPANIEELRKLGLAPQPAPAPEPQLVKVVGQDEEGKPAKPADPPKK